MNSLEDLRKQLAVICVESRDKDGYYRTRQEILNDIGDVYTKYWNIGVSLSTMRLLDQVYKDIVKDWDDLTKEYQKNESCGNWSQIIESKREELEYIEMVNLDDQRYKILV